MTEETGEPQPGTYWEAAVLRRFVNGSATDLDTVRAQVGALLAEHIATTDPDDGQATTACDTDLVNPKTAAEPLVGHRVTLTFTDGRKRTGTLLGCGPQGLQITSGIGGRMLFAYGEIDAIKDLGGP